MLLNIQTITKPFKSVLWGKKSERISNRYANFQKDERYVSILTTREKSVLLGLIKNVNIHEIADELTLSPFTVIFYLNNIQRKLLS
ncbi:MAG: hypothetical protein JXR42_05905 [Gammaproteobacteria bacterium]|nr:hypothetical protein [Gammaproteobacteria bacterium]